MSRGRPASPISYIVDLDDVIKKIKEQIIEKGVPMGYYGSDIDVVIPVYESLKEEIGANIIWLLDSAIYSSTKSRFIEPLKAVRADGKENYHIFDKFKGDGFAHRKSYKQFVYDVSHVDENIEHLYLPIYWRVD